VQRIEDHRAEVQEQIRSLEKTTDQDSKV
jgi:ferritin-like metal-binding protein YciE